MIKAIIFDFDGVIAESADIKTYAFVEVFKEYPQFHEKILEYHKTNMGLSRHVKFRYFYENFFKQEYTEEIGEKLSEEFSKLVVSKIIKAPLVRGVKEFFNTYAQQFICFIASGTPQDEMKYIAKEKKISDYFKEICGTPRTKEEITVYLLKKYSLQPHEVVFVGDAMSDYEAAMATSIHFIGRLTRYVVFPSEVIGVKDLSGLDKVIYLLE